MPSDAGTAFLATCAVAAQIFLVAIAFIFLGVKLGVPAAKNVVNDLRVTFGEQTLWLAAIVAIVATGGSLYFSEIRHFPPCKLCWFQRIAMYPFVPMLLVAAWRRDRWIKTYVIIQATLGACVS